MAGTPSMWWGMSCVGQDAVNALHQRLAPGLDRIQHPYLGNDLQGGVSRGGAHDVATVGAAVRGAARSRRWP